MKDIALYFLYRAASKIPQNQFAKAIYNSFKRTGENVNLSSLKLLMIPFDNETTLDNNTPIEIEKNKDYRFLYLYLKSFRKFPESEAYYGISFCSQVKDNSIVPESTLLQGENGTGKTSIFGAMEYLFTNKISAAEKQGFRTKDSLDDYIPYAGSKKEDVDLNVATQSFVFSHNSKRAQQKEIPCGCLSPFFCSEYDVDKVIASNFNKLVIDKVIASGLSIFIYDQMGYLLIMRIIHQIDSELQEAEKQYIEREESLENIQARIVDLDREIGILLWPSILSLLFKMRNKPKTKEQVEELKGVLSKRFVIQTDADSANEKALALEELNVEKEAISNVFGRKKIPPQAKQPYMQMEKLLGPSQFDPLLHLSVNKKDDMEIALDEFNNFRRCFRVVLDKLLGIDALPDTGSMVEWYDSILREFKTERQDAEKKRLMWEEADFIISQKEVYVDFLNTLKTLVYGKIDTLTTASRELVNEVMALFVMDDERMQVDFDKNKGEFKMNIILSTDGMPVSFSPEKYLNTFRYKLFCMTLKMSIAFAMKQFYKINFPIVIDDVFYSSDFVHRSMVENFFRLLFTKHRKLFANDTLQVIFFSHDEMVIDSAYKGIKSVTSQVNRQMLFDYREIEEQDKVTKSISKNEKQSIAVKMTMLTDLLS